MDINDILFPGSDARDVPAGSLLIAEPLMNDAYFGRSVVLLLDSPDDGSQLGLVLNRKTDFTLKDLMPEWERGMSVPVYCGGPVELERMFLLHTLGDKLGPSVEILPGIFVGADINKIIDYVESGGEVEGKIRFFLGYSGWAASQLNAEISRKSWAVNQSPDTKQLLTIKSDDLWRKEVEKLGDEYRGWLIVPTDPALN